MLGAVKKLVIKLNSFEPNKAVKKVFENSAIQAEVISLNQQQLYDKGIQSDGTTTGEYANNTIYGTPNYPGKIQKRQPYEHVTLKDTGKYYKSMNVVAKPDKLEMNAHDPNNLEERWPNALGLTNESITEIKPMAKSGYLNELLNHIRA